MHKTVSFLILASSCGAASATDFGVRTLGSTPSRTPTTSLASPGKVDVHSASLLGATFGRITSILRSPSHNRAVGGVANSYHLHGRAIDIARRPGVTHRQIDAALRRAGFHLLESLDEGDHSHFAFGGAGERSAHVATRVTSAQLTELTRWGIVYAPR